MKKLVYICCLFALFACQKQAGIIIPDLERSLTVNSSLCLDSVIHINLSYTQSITDNSAPVAETNANIELYNRDTVLLEILTHSSSGNYISTAIKGLAGEKYIIRIITPKQVYWTSDSLPARIDGKILSADSINFHNNPYFYQITYQLKDKNPYQNYYGLKVKHYYEEIKPNDTLLKEEWINIETIDPILIEDINSRFSKQQLLFTDKYFNNSVVDIEFGTSKIINTTQYRSKYLVIFNEQYTFDAYRYYSSLNEHIFYQNDPFSQPINVEGNIKNAYGAFTGKSIRTDTLTFKF